MALNHEPLIEGDQPHSPMLFSDFGKFAIHPLVDDFHPRKIASSPPVCPIHCLNAQLPPL